MQVAETKEFRKNMVYSSATSLNNTEVSLKVLAYRGASAVPAFIDDDDSEAQAYAYR